MIGSLVRIKFISSYYDGQIGIIVKLPRSNYVYDWIIRFFNNVEMGFAEHEFEIIKRRDLGLFL